MNSVWGDVQPVEHKVSKIFSPISFFNILLFVLPFFFIPVFADVFNVGKTYLILFVSVLGLLWFSFMAYRRKILFVRSFSAYLPFILLLTAGVIAVFFSIHKNISVLGSYGAYHQSLIFIAALTLISFVAANAKINIWNTTAYLSLGTLITTIIALIALYTGSIPFLDEVPSQFNLLNSTHSLFALQAVVAVAGLFYISTKDIMAKLPLSILFMLSVVINGSYLIFGMNYLAIAILILGIIYIYAFSNQYRPENKFILIPALLLLAVVSFGHIYPVTRDAMGVSPIEHSARLPFGESWIISVEALRDFPLTGSGLGTFFMGMTQYKPSTLNMGNLWEMRFNQPFNDMFLWMATAGLAGILAYLGFWFLVLKMAWGMNREKSENSLLFLLTGTVFLALVLLGSNITIYVLLAVIVGVLAQKRCEKVTAISSSYASTVLLVISILLLAGLGYLSLRVFAGQYYFRKSLTESDGGQRILLQQKAINSMPYEDFYRRTYASTNLALAVQLSNNITEDNQSEEMLSAVMQFAQESLSQAIYLTEVSNPYDAANWEARAEIYKAMIPAVPTQESLQTEQGRTTLQQRQNLISQTLSAYNQAALLDPNNAKLRLSIGSFYYSQQDYVSAVDNFVRSVQLKPDYANARYNLAFALKEAQAYADAVAQMEVVLRLVPKDSEDFAKAQKDLEEFKVLLEEQQEAQLQAQQEQLETTLPSEPEPEEVEAALEEEQEPLQNPEETTMEEPKVSGEISSGIVETETGETEEN